MSCQHLPVYNNLPDLLNPYNPKITWICLSDGCIKFKKRMSKEELVTAAIKLQAEHRVMINSQTLQIYCTICKTEIFDDQVQVQESPTKTKKYKRINPYVLRQLLMPEIEHRKQQNMFSGTSQYPPSFQKEKRGLCGLKKNSISCYINSLVHLLANVPAFAQICQLIALNKIESPVVNNLFEAIETIWSGKFRIFSIKQLQKQIIRQNASFLSYQNKTAQNLLYFILSAILKEFAYYQANCINSELITCPFNQWDPHTKHKMYNPISQLFGGECILQKVCKSCGKIEKITSFFQCLKVSYQKGSYYQSNFKANICSLIEQALSWRSRRNLQTKKIEQNKLECINCSKPVKQFKNYVNFPNNLIVQFGEQLQGLNVTLPDQIDLSSYLQQQVQKNKSQSARFEYIGAMSSQFKRYFTHARHQNGKEYSYHDEYVEEQPRPTHSIKIAIYKRIQAVKLHPLARNLNSTLKVNICPIVPLPDLWSVYLNYNYEVQPLMNPFICEHGLLKMNLSQSKLKGGPQKIPIQIYNYLLQIFGGRKIKITKQNDYCLQCEQKLEMLRQVKSSQKEMATFANKLSQKKQLVLIRRDWLQSWKKFVYQDWKKQYKIFGFPRPGPIDNRQYKPQKQKEDFKLISSQVWYFLHKFYGGGPLISPKGMHPNIVLKTSVNLRFQSLYPILQKLSMVPKKQQMQIFSNQIVQLQQQHAIEH